MEKVNFIVDGKSEELFILMQTVVSETTYILVSNEDPDVIDDCDCFILKAVSEVADDTIYEPIDSDEEYISVSKIFEELLDEEGIGLI